MRNGNVAVAKFTSKHRDAYHRIPGKLLPCNACVLSREKVAQHPFAIISQKQQGISQDEVEVTPRRSGLQPVCHCLKLHETHTPLFQRDIFVQAQRRKPGGRFLGEWVGRSALDEFSVKRCRLGGIARVSVELRDAREVVQRAQTCFVVGAGLTNGLQQGPRLINVALELGLGIE